MPYHDAVVLLNDLRAPPDSRVILRETFAFARASANVVADLTEHAVFKASEVFERLQASTLHVELSRKYHQCCSLNDSDGAVASMRITAGGAGAQLRQTIATHTTGGQMIVSTSNLVAPIDKDGYAVVTLFVDQVRTYVSCLLSCTDIYHRLPLC